MSWTPELDFELVGKTKSGKTAIWNVRNGIVLGEIKWYAHWRRYCFYPAPETLYDAVCLRQVADFCEAQTEKQKASR